jgi:hypothetical protein
MSPRSSASLPTSLVTAAFLAALGLSGCANFATFQEADTLPKGEIRKGSGISYTTYEIEDPDGKKDTIEIPQVTGWLRAGLTEHLEAHASIWMPLGASIGAKYQLIGSRAQNGLALSLGLDVGALSITTTDENGKENTAKIIDTYVPAYLGYRLSPTLAGYMSPKYILRSGFDDTSSDFAHLVGSTFGVAIGDVTTLMLEGTVMYDLSVGAPAFQTGVGLEF